MAHKNIIERQIDVSKMMKNIYTKDDMKALAKKYNTTYNSIYMDIIYLTYKDVKGVTRFISKSLRENVRKRDNGICQYCGCNDSTMIAEHVIPYVKGGVGKNYNVVLSCQSCNLKKSSKVLVPNNIEVLRGLNPEWCDKIIKLSDRHCYTYSNWLEFKKYHNLTNRKIAEIIGTSEQNVKIMSNPKKELSTWMKAFLYSWVNEPVGVDYLLQNSKPKELYLWGKKITQIPVEKEIINQKLNEWKKK